MRASPTQAIRSSAALVVARESPAAEHARRGPIGPLRLIGRRLLVPFRIKPVVAPLIYVAVHIEDAEAVGPLVSAPALRPSRSPLPTRPRARASAASSSAGVFSIRYNRGSLASSPACVLCRSRHPAEVTVARAKNKPVWRNRFMDKDRWRPIGRLENSEPKKSPIRSCAVYSSSPV